MYKALPTHSVCNGGCGELLALPLHPIACGVVFLLMTLALLWVNTQLLNSTGIFGLSR